MKKWHVEGILSLNDINKTKLAIPESSHIPYHSFSHGFTKKEPTVLALLRRLIVSLLRNL